MASKFLWALSLVLIGSTPLLADDRVDIDSDKELIIPKLSTGEPAPGCRVIVRTPEYVDTKVFHTLYLPEDWKKDGPPLPIIFEYTGNQFAASGSTGKPEDAALGFGLTGGRFIWVSLPYVSLDHQENAVQWWGDEAATIKYAKTNVPHIIRQYNANPKAVFLCGFSRGAIGVNYIGLHDNEIASLWTAFITHDHFDGVREWKSTAWGSPLEKYRSQAIERLKRVSGRPYLVSQQGETQTIRDFVTATISGAENFEFVTVDAQAILGSFPNEVAKSSHTDRWLLKPSGQRKHVWQWINEAAK